MLEGDGFDVHEAFDEVGFVNGLDEVFGEGEEIVGIEVVEF